MNITTNSRFSINLGEADFTALAEARLVADIVEFCLPYSSDGDRNHTDLSQQEALWLAAVVCSYNGGLKRFDAQAKALGFEYELDTYTEVRREEAVELAFYHPYIFVEVICSVGSHLSLPTGVVSEAHRIKRDATSD